MVQLTGTLGAAQIAPGIEISAPGYEGSAERLDGPLTGAAATDTVRGSPAFAAALEQSGVTLDEAVELDLRPTGRPGAGPIRAPAGIDGAERDVAELRVRATDAGQVAMLTDEHGVISFHLPEPDADAQPDDGVVRTAAATRTFLVPIEKVAAPPAAGLGTAEEDRSVVWTLGKKVVSFLSFPLLRWGALQAAEFLERRKPHRLRRYTEHDYQLPLPQEESLTPDHIAQLGGRRSLLFVHGTFSSAHGGFGGLDLATIRSLHQRYEHRVFAFDHPTLSVDVEHNVREFEQLLGGHAVDLDIVAHSRGGLVARVLAGELGAVPGITVDKIVYAATPNTGTTLVDPAHMVSMLNRYTALLNLIPPGPWSVVTDALDWVLTAVRLLGEAFLAGLPGLQSMNPTGPFLTTRLNVGGPSGASHYAISADVEPTGSAALLFRAGNPLVDDVFGQRANDLVVPTAGVAQVPADPGWPPIAPQHALTFGPVDNVWHCSIFTHPRTRQALLAWL